VGIGYSHLSKIPTGSQTEIIDEIIKRGRVGLDTIFEWERRLGRCRTPASNWTGKQSPNVKKYRLMEDQHIIQKQNIHLSVRDPSTIRWNDGPEGFAVPKISQLVSYAIVTRCLFGITLGSSFWQRKLKHSLRKSEQWCQGTIENGRPRSNGLGSIRLISCVYIYFLIKYTTLALISMLKPWYKP